MIDVRRMHLVGRNLKHSFVNISSPERAVVSIGYDNIPVYPLHISKLRRTQSREQLTSNEADAHSDLDQQKGL